MGTTKYIMSMGELYRKDNSLCFRKNGQNVYIPVENTKEIIIITDIPGLFIPRINITVDGC